MKKIIDWLYWEGIRKFIITSFIVILGGTILIGIENTKHIGGIVLISWLICGFAYLIFARWYEKNLKKLLTSNQKCAIINTERNERGNHYEKRNQL